MPAPFSCEVSPAREGVVALSLAGELDMSTVEEAARAVRTVQDQADAGLVVDLRRLSFMDATGLHFLLDTAALTQEAGMQLTLVRGPPAVHRLLEITALDRTLTVVDVNLLDGEATA
jgi:anti-anti-sigma factor